MRTNDRVPEVDVDLEVPHHEDRVAALEVDLDVPEVEQDQNQVSNCDYIIFAIHKSHIGRKDSRSRSRSRSRSNDKKRRSRSRS